MTESGSKETKESYEKLNVRVLKAWIWVFIIIWIMGKAFWITLWIAEDGS